MYDRLYKDSKGHGQSQEDEMLVEATVALRAGLLPASVRATLYRAMAQIGGVEISDTAVNLDGKVGTGFTVSSPALRDETASVVDVVDFDLEEVLELYRAVQWTTYTNNPQVLQAALAGSSRIVVARIDGRLVGLARVNSDGATIAYLQDVLVHPDHQRAGIGAALVGAALTPYKTVRQKVLLTDDGAAQRAFYEALGYCDASEHPQSPLRAFVRFDA